MGKFEGTFGSLKAGLQDRNYQTLFDAIKVDMVSGEGKNVSEDGEYPETGSLAHVQEAILFSLGERAATRCLNNEQEDELNGLNKHIEDLLDKNADFDTIAIAANIVQLAVKANCARCINPACYFRRKPNPALASTKRDQYFEPMEEGL